MLIEQFVDLAASAFARARYSSAGILLVHLYDPGLRVFFARLIRSTVTVFMFARVRYGSHSIDKNLLPRRNCRILFIFELPMDYPYTAYLYYLMRTYSG